MTWDHSAKTAWSANEGGLRVSYGRFKKPHRVSVSRRAGFNTWAAYFLLKPRETIAAMHNMTFWTTAVVTGFVASVGCEFWARFMHRYVWHGPLWALHKSHHAGPDDVAPNPARPLYWEANDLFALGHGALAMGLVIAGLNMRHAFWGGVSVGAGAGLTVFGAAYGLMHDAIIHERVWQIAWGRGYWRRVRGAHLAHHRTGGAPYGLFLGPYEQRARRHTDAPRSKAASGPHRR